MRVCDVLCPQAAPTHPLCKRTTYEHVLFAESRRSVLTRGSSPTKPLSSPLQHRGATTSPPGVLSPSSESSGVSSRKSSADNLLALDGLYPLPDHRHQHQFNQLNTLNVAPFYFRVASLNISFLQQLICTKIESFFGVFCTTNSDVFIDTYSLKLFIISSFLTFLSN